MKTVLSNEIVNARFGNFHEGFEHRPANAQGADETVELVKNDDGTWSIKSPDGQDWLSIQPSGGFDARPVADPSQPGPWEKFSRVGNVLTELPKDGVDRPLVQLIARDL